MHQHHFVSITVVDAWNGDLKSKTECVKEPFSSITRIFLFYFHATLEVKLTDFFVFYSKATPEMKYEPFEWSTIDSDK